MTIFVKPTSSPSPAIAAAAHPSLLCDGTCTIRGIIWHLDTGAVFNLPASSHFYFLRHAAKQKRLDFRIAAAHCRPTSTLCYAMLRYATLCYATLRYAMLRYATLCYAMLRYAMLRYATLCYAALRCAAAALLLHCATLCHAVLRCATLCYAVLRYATLCYVVLRCATLCYDVLRCVRCATLCSAVLRCAALCCAVLRCAHAVLRCATRYAIMCCCHHEI